jgi:hypothetical protein
LASDADRLVKALYPHLHDAGFRQRTLDDADWADFVNTERPDTKSPVTMACHALSWLCLTGRLGNMRMDGVRAVLAYLRVAKAHLPKPDELRKLAALIDAQPINIEHVHEWFHRNYP